MIDFWRDKYDIQKLKKDADGIGYNDVHFYKLCKCDESG